MRRVSSRQRLVSWDAFDATAHSYSEELSESSAINYESDSYNSEWNFSDTAMSFSQAEPSDSNDANVEAHKKKGSDRKGTKLWRRRRKRDRNTQRSCKNLESPKTLPAADPTYFGGPTMVPSYSWETGQPTMSKISRFDNLIDDIHLGIFSFLDLSSLRSVMSVNRRYRNLLISCDARNFVWMDHCERILHVGGENRNGLPLKFVDDLNLPTAVTLEGEKTEINLSFLLNLVPTSFPTSIDEDTLTPRARLRRIIQQTIPTYRLEEEDRLLRSYQDASTGRSVIQYTGYVGQGDRCIRSDHPLPRPKRRNLEDTNYSVAEFLQANRYNGSRGPSLLDILRSSSKSMTSDNSRFASSSTVLKASAELIPFVVPFVDKNSDDGRTVNITPRFVSYFEVNILKLDDSNCSDDTASRQRPYRTSYKDCVAVGVATRIFHFQSRMPGWDQHSYGYHGDDGGIFHSSGGMLKQFGPKFGPGDTVGCGIDYLSKGIFYTLNGDFLGYAWKGISDEVLEKDLFPIVGIDTNCPIHLNLGSVDSGPFQFDLSNFMKKHKTRISSMYSLDALCKSETTNTAATSKVPTKLTRSAMPSPVGYRKSLVGRRNQRER